MSLSTSLHTSEQKVPLSPWFIWGGDGSITLIEQESALYFWKSQNQQNTVEDTLWAFQYCTLQLCRAGEQMSLPTWCCTTDVNPHAIYKAHQVSGGGKAGRRSSCLVRALSHHFFLLFSPSHPSCECTSTLWYLPIRTVLYLELYLSCLTAQQR